MVSTQCIRPVRHILSEHGNTLVSVRSWPLVWDAIVAVVVVLTSECHGWRAFWQGDRATEFAFGWRDVVVDGTRQPLCILQLSDATLELLNITAVPLRFLDSGCVRACASSPVTPPSLAVSLLIPYAPWGGTGFTCSAYRLDSITLALPIAALLAGQGSSAPFPQCSGLGGVGCCLGGRRSHGEGAGSQRGLCASDLICVACLGHETRERSLEGKPIYGPVPTPHSRPGGPPLDLN